ncbi:MAG TPA: prepilin-type N-terminal cleavage/methylation domain-containing protein [Thermoleophilaceae bacterium]
MLCRRSGGEGERGFTLIEILVAMFLLIVGVLGTIALVDGANASSNAADTRISASNLAREITEDAHAVDYDSLLTSTVVSALRTYPSLTGTVSGGTWIVTRHGEKYAVSVTACKYDNPEDGLAKSHDSSFCTNTSADPSGTDSNGDDFRRVDVTINWTSEGGRTHTLKQTALIVNPSGGLGPRITSMTPQVTVYQPDSPSCLPGCTWLSSGNQAGPFSVTTATPANSLNWSTSDGSPANTISPPSPTTTFSWSWDITNVLDGTYTVNAQPFDDRGVPGDLKTATVYVNKAAPVAPTAFSGGWDTNTAQGDVVDLSWAYNPEHDISGYRVYRDANGNGTYDPGTDTRACPPDGADPSMLTVNYCTDTSPIGNHSSNPKPTYFVMALDLKDATAPSSLREGAATAVTLPDVGPAPTFDCASETLTSAVQDGLPTISWSAPASGNVAFYRIYRDPSPDPQACGVALPLSSRYDFTTGNVSSYSDPSPGSSNSHVYYITAVDSNFNESLPLGPFPAIP